MYKLFNTEFKVPRWANYVAIDDDGELWAYEFSPKRSEELGGWVLINRKGHHKYVTSVDRVEEVARYTVYKLGDD